VNNLNVTSWDWYGYREMNNECVNCCSLITDRTSPAKRPAAVANNNNNNNTQTHVSLILELKF
jgi:hypothetical protein